MLRDEYFEPDELGSWEAMIPGFVDVSKTKKGTTFDNSYKIIQNFSCLVSSDVPGT